MTFFSAPDDAFAARGPFNAVADFWARALDPKMFGLSGGEASQVTEAFWALPMMASRAMADSLAMWSGSFGAICVPAAKTTPAKAPAGKAVAANDKAAAKPVVVEMAVAEAAEPMPLPPVLELPPVILAELAPAPVRDLPVVAPGTAPAEAAPLRAATAEETARLAATVAAIEPEDFQRPKRIERPKAVDDLKLISGVGPKIEKTLNGLGVFTFAQIAGWTPAEIAWVDDYVSFQGRIVRDDWLGQAAALARGGRAEYVRVFGKEPR